MSATANQTNKDITFQINRLITDQRKAVNKQIITISV